MASLDNYFNKRLLTLVIPIVLAAVFAGLGALPTAHAGGYPSGPGLVCLNDASAVPPAPANPCPSTAYTFDGPFPSTPQSSPSQIRVGVYVNGSAGLFGLDVTLLADHTVLSPAGIDFSGTVLSGTPVIINECSAGILVSGSACSPTDTADTLHLAATSQLGAPNTPSPTTGLLFTAIYNVVGASPTGGTSVSFQTGCSNTSVPGGVCVTISNGTVTPNLESVQTGSSFNNSGNTISWLAETSNSSAVVTVPGAATGNAVNITTTAENGWPGLSTDTVTFTTAASSGFTAPFLSANTCSPAACSITATLNTGAPGTYSATIYGTYVAFDSNGLTVTLVAPVTIQVTVRGVAWTINGIAGTASPTNYMSTTANLPLTFTAQSLGGYSGTITYSTNSLTDGGTGITFTYPAPFAIASGATVTKTISGTATNQGAALYQATLSATGLPIQNSGTITVRVSGFTLTTNTTSLTFDAGKSAGLLVTSTSLGNPSTTNGFAGPVTISKIVSGPGAVTVTCKSPLILTAGGTVSGTCTITGTTAGTYAVTLTGTGGTNKDMTNSTSVTVTILTVSGFKLAANPTSQTITAGSAGVSTITITSTGSFSQSVSLSTVAYPSTLVCTLSSTSVTPPAGGAVTSTLSCSGPAGFYTVTLTASSTGFTSKTATLNYNVQDFSLSVSSPGVVDVSQSATSTLMVTSLQGFSGTITLTANPSVGLSATLSTATLVGGSGSSVLTLTAATSGGYSVTVTATSSSLSHTSLILVQVVDFQIFANPTFVTTTPGVSVASTVTITPLNGFTGTVSLTNSVLPSTGLSCSANPAGKSGGSGSSTLTCTGVGGSYVVTVTGTDGSISHTTMVTVNVQDFQVTAGPSSISVAQGGCTSNTITVLSLGGFTGTVSLGANAPSGIAATLTPTVIVNSGTSTLTVCASTTTATGPFAVNITGLSGGVSHSATISASVTTGTSTSPPVITQATWNHRFSLSKYSNVLSFKLGATNPSSVTEYVSLKVVATSNDGLSSFILNSPVIALGPGQNVNHITLSQTFSSSQIGQTFTFNISIQWGLTATTDPAQLPFNSTTAIGSPTTGTFTVLA